MLEPVSRFMSPRNIHNSKNLQSFMVQIFVCKYLKKVKMKAKVERWELEDKNRLLYLLFNKTESKHLQLFIKRNPTHIYSKI